MAILDWLARKLECRDEPAAAEAIFVLSGGEGEKRLSAGLDLLSQGYAPRLLVSCSFCHATSPEEAKAAAQGQEERIHWLPNDAVSTREEVIEAREALEQLQCTSVLVVTSSYHTRRTKEICRRELVPHGIKVRVVPVVVAGLDARSWWKCQVGRAVVLFEVAKLFCTWLRFDPSISTRLRLRLRGWVYRVIP